MSATSAAKSSPSGGQATAGCKPKRLPAALALLAAAILAAFLALGLWPVPADNPDDEAAVGISDRSNGLRQSFPAMVARPDNLATDKKNAERVALGRLLFFDPIMSGGNDTSCATCHHPDLGLSDGRPLSMGRGGRGIGPDRQDGIALRRSAPSLWNVGYYHRQLWDGRAKDLEEQAVLPIVNEQEMDEAPERLLSELKEIPEYVERFDRAFEGFAGPTLSMENIARALSAFERTLTANNSAFDRFAAGERAALTDAQRRGFNVFRAGRTRCIECHGLPTFAGRDFKVVGIVDSGVQSDLGRFEITQKQADKFAFKIPTLRNVALSAPYMHNGNLKDLDEVIDFYSSGGQPRLGTPVNDKLRAFRLTKQERQDLIAFLFSLTDESNLPVIPNRVPSGLPVVPHLDNPARKLVASYNKVPASEKSLIRPPQLLRVEADQSIQKAIDRAQPGDIIDVMPGVYHEHLAVDVDNLTLRAVTSAPRTGDAASSPDLSGGMRRPILDGKKEMSDGLIVSGRNFRFEGFEIRNYVANAVLSQYARNLALIDLRVQKAALSGIYIVNTNEVTIENVVASEAADVGIYINSSRNTRIANCESYGNAVGILLENCLGTAVETNFVHDNTCGILVAALPDSMSTVAKDCRITNNRILNNNATNTSEIGTLIGELASGTGILILGADNTEVNANEIRGNVSYGVGVGGLYSFTDSGVKFEVGAVPENNWIHDNTYSDNGGNPANAVSKARLGGGDLAWDLSGWSNRWNEAKASRATPVLNGEWPAFARRAYWRILNFF